MYVEARLGAEDLLATVPGREVARRRPAGVMCSWYEFDCFEGGFNRRSRIGSGEFRLDSGRRLPLVGMDSIAFISS